MSLEKNYYFHTHTHNISLFLKHKYMSKCSLNHEVCRFQTKYFVFPVKNKTSLISIQYSLGGLGGVEDFELCYLVRCKSW